MRDHRVTSGRTSLLTRYAWVVMSTMTMMAGPTRCQSLETASTSQSIPSASSSTAAAAAGQGDGGGGRSGSGGGVPCGRRSGVGGGNASCVSECQCTVTGVVLQCLTRDSMFEFPVIRGEFCLNRVREIIIRDQPRLVDIDQSTIGSYPFLEKLTIQYSGLKTIAVEAFKTNRYLKIINLQSNELTALSWSTFIDAPRIVDVDVAGNPLLCSCDVRWMINTSAMFPSLSLRPPERCRDGSTNRLLRNMKWPACDVPLVDVWPKRIEVNASGRVELTCSGRGTLRPDVRWNLPHWPPDGHELRRSEDNLTVTLAIAAASPRHSGVVWCFADNRAGRAKTSAAIVVFSAPKILELDEVRDEFNQFIPYKISGLPAPSVTWYRDSVALETNEVIYEEQTTAEAFVSRQGRLVFTIANHLNNGNYTLVAENGYGSDRRSIDAIFLNPPDDGLFHHPSLPYFDDADVPGYLHRNDSYRLSGEEEDDEYLRSKFAVLVTVAAIAGGILLLVIFVVVVVCSLVCCQRKRKSSAAASHRMRFFRSLWCPDRNRSSIYCDTIAREMIPLNSARIVDNPNYFKQESTNVATAKVLIPHIPRQNISILRDLGEGAFGRVVLGSCRMTEPTGERLTLVAIKTLKECHAEDAKRDFEREAELLTSLQHDNIVRLYGISEDGETRMIIFEYMENGDLNNFLRSHSPETRFSSKDAQLQQLQQQTPKPSLRLRDLLHVSRQIASGAEYLAKSHFVHRDMATRNCLVGEKLTVKIGDFGMSRDVYSADYYKVGGQTMLPIRWMPYESIIYRTFTMESDVWSFGVVLWEIFSFGKQPWYELTNHEVIQHLEMGKVLDCPVGGHCPEEVYRLMLGCWRKHPEDRLTMNQLHVHLTRLLQYFDNDPTDGSTQDYAPKHVSYLEIVNDDAV